MRLKWPNEVAQMVAEDNDQVRALVKGTHENFRDPSKVDGQIVPNTILPLRKIRGSVHFANKAESKPLQLADLCAFVIRGHLARHPRGEQLFDRVRLMILNMPEEDIIEGRRSPSVRLTCRQLGHNFLERLLKILRVVRGFDLARHRDESLVAVRIVSLGLRSGLLGMGRLKRFAAQL